MRLVEIQSETEANFKELLLLAPRSSSLMRAYASFLLDVMNDPAKASEFLVSAETIEDEQSHAHNLLISDVQFGSPIDFDLSIDNLSLIRISTDPEKLGIVTTANPAMLKTFGYQPREIIGHDVEMLFPAPFAEVHSQYVRNYVTTGDERLISMSRIYFGYVSHTRARNVFQSPCKRNVYMQETQIWCIGPNPQQHPTN
jgi:PAS domain S-box-containing protein